MNVKQIMGFSPKLVNGKGEQILKSRIGYKIGDTLPVIKGCQDSDQVLDLYKKYSSSSIAKMIDGLKKAITTKDSPLTGFKVEPLMWGHTKISRSYLPDKKTGNMLNIVSVYDERGRLIENISQSNKKTIHSVWKNNGDLFESGVFKDGKKTPAQFTTWSKDLDEYNKKTISVHKQNYTDPNVFGKYSVIDGKDVKISDGVFRKCPDRSDYNLEIGGGRVAGSSGMPYGVPELIKGTIKGAQNLDGKPIIANGWPLAGWLPKYNK